MLFVNVYLDLTSVRACLCSVCFFIMCPCLWMLVFYFNSAERWIKLYIENNRSITSYSLRIAIASDNPVRRSHRNIAMTFGTEKLEWSGYPMVKNWRYDYSFWQNSRTWQMDTQTDGRTPHGGIGRACIASRGKNQNCFCILAVCCFLLLVWVSNCSTTKQNTNQELSSALHTYTKETAYIKSVTGAGLSSSAQI